MRYLTPLLAVALLAACSSKPATTASPLQETKPSELALPDVPDSLTLPEARAAYVVSHFWDKMDFADTALSLDTAFMEQSFANFASVLPLADSASVATGVDRLMSGAEAVAGVRDFVAYIAEHYLYDPASPMYNEDSYIYFLRRDLASPTLSDAEKVRPAELLKGALKNRPGMTAANFSLITRDGRTADLHSLVAANPGTTVLIFYDPDCDTCHSVIERLSKATFTDGTQIIAVDAEGDRAQWDDTKASMPAGWTVAYATTPVLDEELYLLPAMPTIYILDRDSRVLIKDADPSGI